MLSFIIKLSKGDIHMKNTGKIGMILAKLTEIGFWIATVCMGVVFVLCLVKPAGFVEFTSRELAMGETSIEAMGLSISNIPVSEGSVAKVLLGFCPAAAILFSLTAMIFRNLYLIMKNLRADQKEDFSEENSPFQPDIIRMVREIGIFALSIPVVELIANEILFLVFRQMHMEVEMGGLNLSMVAFGMVVLYLSSIFSYGAKLQQDTEGLV